VPSGLEDKPSGSGQLARAGPVRRARTRWTWPWLLATCCTRAITTVGPADAGAGVNMRRSDDAGVKNSPRLRGGVDREAQPTPRMTTARRPLRAGSVRTDPAWMC